MTTTIRGTVRTEYALRGPDGVVLTSPAISQLCTFENDEKARAVLLDDIAARYAPEGTTLMKRTVVTGQWEDVDA